MGKFFKTAKRRDRNDEKETRRAIAEKALIETISPNSRPDSIGFFTGAESNRILRRDIKPTEYAGHTFLKNVDPMKVKNLARKYTDKMIDPDKSNPIKKNNFDKDKMLDYVGASNMEKMFVTDSRYSKHLKEFRTNVGKAVKQNRYNISNDIAYEAPGVGGAVATHGLSKEDKIGG